MLILVWGLSTWFALGFHDLFGFVVVLLLVFLIIVWFACLFLFYMVLLGLFCGGFIYYVVYVLGCSIVVIISGLGAVITWCLQC